MEISVSTKCQGKHHVLFPQATLEDTGYLDLLKILEKIKNVP